MTNINIPVSAQYRIAVPRVTTLLVVTSSTSWTAPTGCTTIELLVVAGGGGGGMDMAGGGGAGGVRYLAATPVTPGTTYPIVIGAGGAGAPAAGTFGQPSAHQYTIGANAGSDSSFGGVVALGGGRGGSSVYTYTPGAAGGNGGSGGGASGYSNDGSGRSGGTGVAGQGFKGGKGGGAYYSGGGGGAGAVGVDSPGIPHGGAGLQFPSLSSFYFGGGGGGAAYSVSPGGNGGIGGGGGGAVGTTTGGAGINNGSPGGGGVPNAWANTPGGNAGANTGGGGGGGAHYNANNKGGDGGSGIVILKAISYGPVPTPLTYRFGTVFNTQKDLDYKVLVGIIDIQAQVEYKILNTRLFTCQMKYTFDYPVEGDLVKTLTDTVLLNYNTLKSGTFWYRVLKQVGLPVKKITCSCTYAIRSAIGVSVSTTYTTRVITPSDPIDAALFWRTYVNLKLSAFTTRLFWPGVGSKVRVNSTYAIFRVTTTILGMEYAVRLVPVPADPIDTRTFWKTFVWTTLSALKYRLAWQDVGTKITAPVTYRISKTYSSTIDLSYGVRVPVPSLPTTCIDYYQKMVLMRYNLMWMAIVYRSGEVVTTVKIVKDGKYEIQNVVPGTEVPCEYNILTITAATVSVEYVINAGILIPKSSKYAIQSVVVLDRAEKYTIRTKVTTQASVAYSMLGGHIKKTAPLTYRFTTSTAASCEVSYIFRVVHAATATVQYRLFAGHLDTKTCTYRFITTSSTSNTIAYSVGVYHRTLLDITYVVCGTHLITKSSTYQLWNSYPVAHTHLLYYVRSLINTPLTTQYRVDASHLLEYNLRYRLWVATSALTRTAHYDIAVPTDLQIGLDYRIYAPVIDIPKGVVYAIRSKVQITPSVDYDINIGSTIHAQVVYRLYIHVGIDKSCVYRFRTHPVWEIAEQYVVSGIRTTVSCAYVVTGIRTSVGLVYRIKKVKVVAAYETYRFKTVTLATKLVVYTVSGIKAAKSCSYYVDSKHVVARSLVYKFITSPIITKTSDYIIWDYKRRQVSREYCVLSKTTLEHTCLYNFSYYERMMIDTTYVVTGIRIPIQMEYIITGINLATQLVYRLQHTHPEVTRELGYNIGWTVSTTSDITYGVTGILQSVPLTYVQTGIRHTKPLRYAFRVPTAALSFNARYYIQSNRKEQDIEYRVVHVHYVFAQSTYVIQKYAFPRLSMTYLISPYYGMQIKLMEYYIKPVTNVELTVLQYIVKPTTNVEIRNLSYAVTPSYHLRQQLVTYEISPTSRTADVEYVIHKKIQVILREAEYTIHPIWSKISKEMIYVVKPRTNVVPYQCEYDIWPATTDLPIPLKYSVQYLWVYVSHTSGYTPFTPTFTYRSNIAATAWNWDFGDGQTSNKQYVACQYLSAGTYTITLTITGILDGETVTMTSINSVTVTTTTKSLPIAIFSYKRVV